MKTRTFEWRRHEGGARRTSTSGIIMDRALNCFIIHDSSYLRAGSHGVQNIRGSPSQRRLNGKLAVRAHGYGYLWARGDGEENQLKIGAGRGFGE